MAVITLCWKCWKCLHSVLDGFIFKLAAAHIKCNTEKLRFTDGNTLKDHFWAKLRLFYQTKQIPLFQRVNNTNHYFGGGATIYLAKHPLFFYSGFYIKVAMKTEL